MLSSFHQKKIQPWSGKPQYFTYILKASEQIINTHAFYETVMKEVLELLVNYFICYAKSVTFPELALPAIIQLKLFLQSCAPSAFPSRIKQFVDVLDEQTKVILSHRNLANFNPSDEHKVASFMSNIKQKTPLEIYYQKFEKEKEEQKKLIEQQEQQEREQQPPEELKPSESLPEEIQDEEEDDFDQDDELKQFKLEDFTNDR